MTRPRVPNPFMPLPPMTCRQLSELLVFVERWAPEVQVRPNGQHLYCFADGLILSLCGSTGRVVFQGAGAAGLTAQAIAERIVWLNR